MESEIKVAEFSGYENKDFYFKDKEVTSQDTETSVALITEGKIRNSLIGTINDTSEGNNITIGMFYLTQRDTIESLVRASERGVNIKLILDPNKDTFWI